MPGADLREEAAFGLGEVEVAAPYGPRRPARRPCREGSRGVTVAYVLLPAGLLSFGDGGPVRLLGGRRWRRGRRRAPYIYKAGAEDSVPDSLGFYLIVWPGQEDGAAVGKVKV